MHFDFVFCEQKTDRLKVYPSFLHTFSQRQARANLCQFMMLTNRPTFFRQFFLYDGAENFQCVCVMSGCEGHPSQDLLIKGGGKQLHRLLSKPTLKNHDICLRLYSLQKVLKAIFWLAD